VFLVQKLTEKPDFGPKTGLFRGVLFTITTTESTSGCLHKQLIKLNLEPYLNWEASRKEPYSRFFGGGGGVSGVSPPPFCSVEDHCAPMEVNSLQAHGVGMPWQL
jgi:hypothetical protein